MIKTLRGWFLSSYFWGLLYIGMIPIYAGFYTIFPSEFYSSMGQYDPIASATADEIADQLSQQLEKCSHSGPEFEFRLSPAKGMVGFQAISDTISYSGMMFLHEGLFVRPGNESSARRVLSDGGVPLKIEFPEVYTSNFSQTASLPDYIKIPIVTRLALCLNPFDSNPTIYNRFDDSEFQVLVSQRLAHEIALLSGSQTHGYIGGYQNQYLRFLYFSTVTITTLGYGDILPVTDRMRALVASQSVLGVVLIGLFLNALARRRNTS